MADLNRVFLTGNLGRDVEVRTTAGGMSVGSFSLASNRKWTSKDGEQREEVTWVDVTVFNSLADNCARYIGKGSKVLVDGYLKLESWDDRQSGEKRQRIKVVAESVTFLDGPQGRGDQDQGRPAARASSPAPREASPKRGNGKWGGGQPAPQGATRGRAQPEPEDEDQDIPF